MEISKSSLLRNKSIKETAILKYHKGFGVAPMNQLISNFENMKNVIFLNTCLISYFEYDDDLTFEAEYYK
jgi:hypothetical protein